MTDQQGKAFVVEGDAAGLRLDVFLRERIEGLGRAGARRLAEEGRVRVNGRRAPKSHVLAAGDEVRVEDLLEASVAVTPEDDPALVIAYEDEDVVVVDKRAGVPTQPLRPGERGTVANALVARYPEMAGLGPDARDAGLIHRLDVGTSGLLLAARTKQAFEALTEALRAEGIDKEYLALVRGTPEAPRVVDYALASEPGERRRMRACFSLDEIVRYDGKPATTELLEATEHGAYTLLRVRARKAVRHQVRAHLAAEGYPLVGDTLYGGPEAPGVTHHLLHASLLAFDHLRSGQRIELKSPAPSTWPR